MNGLRVAFSLELLQVFIYAYAALKWTLKTEDSNPPLKNTLIITLRIVLTIFISLLTYIIIIFFAVYYEIIKIILKIKHKDDFVGILHGTDVIWTVEEKTKSFINSLFMLEIPESENHEHVHKFFAEAYAKLCETHRKMGCVRKNFMGYLYFKKTKIDINKFVRYMDDYADENEFQLLLDKYSNSDLPLNNKASWEILVGKVPLKWKRGEKPLYPVLIKYHHSVGDGITIVAMCTTNMLQNGENLMKEKCEAYKALLKKNKSKKKVRSLVEKIVDVCSKEYYIKYSGPLTEKEFNLLHGKELSGEKQICYSLEGEMEGYVDKVKAIKNRFDGISFSDVILTALSASFAEYYIKHDQYPPNTIRAALTFFFSSSDYKKIIKHKNGQPVSKLSNNFSLGIVNLPLNDKDLSKNLVKRLFDVNKDANKLKNSLDYAFVYWQLKTISEVVPMPLLLLSIKSNDSTIVVTNVPGNNTATLLSGHIIRDTIIWAPNYIDVGLSFSIFTYDNLFRFGLMVDKVLIDDRKEVQTIVDNVYKYIDYLDNATKTL